MLLPRRAPAAVQTAARPCRHRPRHPPPAARLRARNTPRALPGGHAVRDEPDPQLRPGEESFRQYARHALHDGDRPRINAKPHVTDDASEYADPATGRPNTRYGGRTYIRHPDGRIPTRRTPGSTTPGDGSNTWRTHRSQAG
jgi:hypothetical protein